MPWKTLLITVITIGLLAGTTQAEDQESKEANVWMKRKLELSKNILGGLANADFDAIARNAEIMKGLNQVERFVRRRKATEYRTQLEFFQFANEEILSNARKDNLDGATLAFAQLTLSCVNCHKQLRKAPK